MRSDSILGSVAAKPAPESGLYPDDDSSVFPDFLVPAQFYDFRRRCGSLEGEARLLFTVLEDAVRIYVRYGKLKRSPSRLEFAEVQRWFHAQDDAPFSFEYVCDSLEIDPEALRKALQNLKAKDFPTKQISSIGRRHLIRSKRSRDTGPRA